MDEVGATGVRTMSLKNLIIFDTFLQYSIVGAILKMVLSLNITEIDSK